MIALDVWGGGTYAVLQQPLLLGLGFPEETLHLLDLRHVGHTGTERKRETFVN